MWQPGKAAQTGASSRESQQQVASLQRHEGKHRPHLPVSAELPVDTARCLTVSKSHQQQDSQLLHWACTARMGQGQKLQQSCSRVTEEKKKHHSKFFILFHRLQVRLVDQGNATMQVLARRRNAACSAAHLAGCPVCQSGTCPHSWSSPFPAALPQVPQQPEPQCHQNLAVISKG